VPPRENRKVNLNKLRAEYASQMRKRKEFEVKMDERRRMLEHEILDEQEVKEL